MILFTNKDWYEKVFNPLSFYKMFSFKDRTEFIAARCCLNPLHDHVASRNKAVFDPMKAAAMYFWYKSADKSDKSILEYFEEYKRCIDDTHQWFNSNYGIYAYKHKGLQRCIDVLLNNSESRQACFCINNNNAMAPSSIDKLCTNAIQFFIRENKLIMIVQMRSSNMLTLLPYDFFIFSIWFAQIYNKLIQKYNDLNVGSIVLEIASLHRYNSNFFIKCHEEIDTNIEQIFSYSDICAVDFEKRLEDKLLTFLNT